MTALPSSLKSPKVALMQPTFMPWMGYFSMILDADLFVFLDDFQFVRGTFHHRNRFCDKSGKEVMISMPVTHAGHQNVALKDANLANLTEFKKKFFGSFLHCYSKAPYYKDILEMIETWLSVEYASLADMNMAFIREVAKSLGAPEDRFRASSSYEQRGERSERILSLLQATNAKTYLCAKGAHDYMKEDGIFPHPEVEVAFQNFIPAEYKQMTKAGFVSHLCILDSLVNIGKNQVVETINKSSKGYDIWLAA